MTWGRFDAGDAAERDLCERDRAADWDGLMWLVLLVLAVGRRSGGVDYE